MSLVQKNAARFRFYRLCLRILLGVNAAPGHKMMQAHSNAIQHDSNITQTSLDSFQPLSSLKLCPLFCFLVTLKPGEVDVKDREDQTALRNSSFYKQAAAQSACTTHVPTLRHLVSRVLSFFDHPSLCLDHAALRHVCALLPDLGPFH